MPSPPAPAPRPEQKRPDAAALCPLCGRAFGEKTERHHLVPRLKGGRKTVELHPICHRKIHSLFSEAELARSFDTIDALRSHPAIQEFIGWLAGKPADFYKATHRKR